MLGSGLSFIFIQSFDVKTQCKYHRRESSGRLNSKFASNILCFSFHTCLCKTWPRYPAASNARCEGPSHARSFPFCLANGRLLCFGYTFCFFSSLSLSFGWLGAAGNTNTTHLQLRTSSGFCPSNIRLPTNQNEPTKSREIQSFADRRITRDMPHAVLHAWGRQARPRRTNHQRCCPPKLKPQSARKSKQ